MSDDLRSAAFGRAIRHEWPLEPEAVYLNHGTVGVTPNRVLDAQERIRRELERHPSRSLLREATSMLGPGGPGALRRAIAEVAAFLGARGDDVVFLDNTTTAVNAVLASARLGPDDAVLITETTYFGVRQAVRSIAERTGARVRVARIPLPVREPHEVVEAFRRALEPDVRLAIVDHIVSETGCVLPVAEIAGLCRDHGVRVLVDGAHAPGQLEVDIPALGAEWYTGNLHKWGLAPRSCGVLWTAPEVQSETHPLVVSWGLDRGYTAEFDWPGTRDLSVWLAAPEGPRLLAAFDAARVRAYNHELLWRAVAELGARWSGRTAAPETMSASMIALELPAAIPASAASAARLRDLLLDRHRIEVPVMCWQDRLWARLSAQIYNDMADFERLAEAIEDLAGELAA